MLRLAMFFSLALITTTSAQTNRTELKKADLTGTNMEVIVAIVEVPPGNNLERPTHNGEEAVYVLEGATLLLPDGSERPFPTGAAVINVRDIPHAGFKVGGDKPLKMLTVHIVDKGKPLMVPTK
jgi:quercetin dioxygenase-like cupin family protein